MTDNEVINEAREAAEYLRMQISEAEMQYERVIKLHKLIDKLWEIPRIFRCVGSLLIELELLKIVVSSLTSFNLDLAFSNFIENMGEFLRLLLNGLPVKGPFGLGLDLLIVSWVFGFLLLLIDQSLISPEEVSKTFKDPLDEARSLLRSLERELNELSAEGGL